MTNKVARKTVDFGHGIKVTVERPYTQQDAIEEFKRTIEAAGGKVTQVQDELTVTGNASTADVMKATQQLSENLGVATTPLNEALRRFGKTIGLDPDFVDRTVDAKRPVQTPTGRLSFPHLDFTDLERRAAAHYATGGEVKPGDYVEVVMPFGFPSFPYIARAADVIRQSTARAKPAPKKVAQVAPKAMSTWEFSSGHLSRMHGQTVNLVGQHFRSTKDQEVLSWKRPGNMALLVAEPDNPVDLNAIMVLAWNDQTKAWHHVGYVRATQASALRGKWTGDFKNAMVARFTNVPRNADGHRGGNNIELTLTGEVRTYPGYKL
ncbi:HIRAN domain containing protein [Rhodobacter phage RcSimone-Hastad]|nr:HIRAN domain containing protein [Rhodobacter phage RcSimone-Hastad]